jgi:hypothetical protein
MTHCTDDDLVLHYYGEADCGPHLAGCDACALQYRELRELLGAVPADVPARGDHYGLEVWHRVRPRLTAPLPWWATFARGASARQAAFRWAMGTAAIVALVASGFVAGKYSTPASPAGAPVTSSAATAPSPAADQDFRRHVLLLSVADHLERSDRVLTDIVNTPGAVDISLERQWARDLIAANRLYRQDALDADESSVATVLDELERALLDIVNGPADAPPADLQRIRQRIDSAALLFKVRVMSNELRDRQRDDDTRPATRSISPIG